MQLRKTNLGRHESWLTRLGSKVADEAPLLNLITDPSLKIHTISKQNKINSTKNVDKKIRRERKRRRNTFSSARAILGCEFGNGRGGGNCRGNREKVRESIEDPWKKSRVLVKVCKKCYRIGGRRRARGKTLGLPWGFTAVKVQKRWVGLQIN